MIIKDDICYAEMNCHDIKVIDLKVLKGMMLLLTFSNGEKKLYDCSKLTGKVFEPLKDEKVFNNIELFHGFPTWDNRNIDIAPEVLYQDGINYNDYDVISSQNINN